MNSRLLIYYFSLLLAAFCVGCADEPDTTVRESENIILNLDVRVAESRGGLSSRADGDYSFQLPINEYETLKNITVVIAKSIQEDESTEVKYVIEQVRTLPCSANINTTSEIFKFEVTPGSKKIYLFGNPESLPKNLKSVIYSLTNGATLPDFSAYIFERQEGEVFFGNTTYIPFSEFFDGVIIEELNKERTNKEQSKQLFITRIPVKFTLRSTTPLSAAKLSSIATSQFVLPNNAVYSPAEEIDGLKGQNITRFSTPSSANPQEFIWTLENGHQITFNGKSYYEYDYIYLMETETPADGFLLAVQPQYQEDWTEAKLLENVPLLPRNTHVVINVDFKGIDAVITANIIPWDTISFELNYTDIVNHEPVVWDSDSYESINKNTIYLTPWGQNIDGQPELVPLKGRKKITLPTGATWTAFLLNNGDDSSAIGFVDQTGIPSLKQISGDYQDTEIVFNIGSNQVDPGDNRNSAILQLVVVLPNGNVYEVPLSSEYATYTIVQNPQ